MAETNISGTEYGNLSGTGTSYSVDPVQTDGATGQKETEYINSDWAQQLGYYKKIPELKAAIDAKATWTVGKGFIADEMSTLTLDIIKGNGKDTFNTILENMIRTYNIGGDSYAEIIRDDEGAMVNIKPLDPSTITIIMNTKGLIIRYEQVGKINKNLKKFKPIDIFHLSRNRVADEMHGESLIDAVEEIILMRNEAMSDMRILMHRHVKPITVFHLDTDDADKISEFKAKADKATDKGENLFIPKGAVELDMQAVASNATLNPLPWIESLNNYFFQATGVPDIIVGGSKSLTEASSKIAYLAFQQTIEEEQLYIEESVGQQLGLLINLEFPASLENEMLSDNKKDGDMSTQPNETTAGVGQ